MSCPCCWGAGLCALAPLASKAMETPKGRATLVALAPLLLLGLALATGLTEFGEVAKTAECLVSCSSMRGYLFGGVAVWLIGIQRCLKSATPPKTDVATPVAPPLDTKGKLAAKAA